MTRFIASWGLGFLLSFGYTTFFHYQLVTGQPLPAPGAATVALLTVVIAAGNFFLSFWNLAGFPQKPSGWELFEEKGIPYTLKRNNLHFLLFIGGSFLGFCGISLGLDLLLGAPLGNTVKGIFFNNGSAELVELSYYWNSNYWYLFIAFYLTSTAAALIIAKQAWDRREEVELKEMEHEAREEDR